MMRRRISFGRLVIGEVERRSVEELLRVMSEEVYFRWTGGSGFGFRFQGRVGGCGMTAGRSGEGTFWRWVICDPIFSSFCFRFLVIIFLRDRGCVIVVESLPVKIWERKFYILQRIVNLTGDVREESGTEFHRLVL